MDLETVSLSRDQFMLAKRLFLNVLSGKEELQSCNRQVLKEMKFPERFLVERAWVIRGARLSFSGTVEQARSFLDELQGVFDSAPAAENDDGVDDAPVSPRLISKLETAIRREEKRPGVWSFPCVFRLTAAELSKMLALDEPDAARVASAVRSIVGSVKMEGNLKVVSKATFVYTRTE
jgi:hypothetical protein